MIHICGSYLFILDNLLQMWGLDPWATAKQQKCSTTVLCYHQLRMLLQGETAGLNACAFGESTPTSPVCIPAPAQLKEKEMWSHQG